MHRFRLAFKNTYSDWSFEKVFHWLLVTIVGFIVTYILVTGFMPDADPKDVVASEVLAAISFVGGLFVAFLGKLWIHWIRAPLILELQEVKSSNQSLLELEKINLYQDSAIIEGGTHNIYEIFGKDNSRRDMVFRNCTIIGLGMVAITQANRENLKINYFHTSTGSMVMKAGPDVANHIKQFFECSFENVTFQDIMIFGYGNQEKTSNSFTAFDNDGLVKAIVNEDLERYVLEHVADYVKKDIDFGKQMVNLGPVRMGLTKKVE